MTSSKIQLGKKGEQLAAAFLKKKGYRIAKRNVRTKFGEIDIVAFDGDTLCFIEVKTRTTDTFGSPLDAISYPKQRRLSKSALSYIKSRQLTEYNARFDIVSVVYDQQGKNTVEIFKNAFEISSGYAY